MDITLFMTIIDEETPRKKKEIDNLILENKTDGDSRCKERAYPPAQSAGKKE
jgi:hypothetical protein